jgi:hypothetical protein
VKSVLVEKKNSKIHLKIKRNRGRAKGTEEGKSNGGEAKKEQRKAKVTEEGQKEQRKVNGTEEGFSEKSRDTFFVCLEKD